MPYDLSAMKLIARGGQADIYEINGSKILRVLRDASAEAAKMLMNERAIMAALRECSVGVPQVFECTGINGLPALEMERITGPSMLERLLMNPLAMGHFAKELARLHCDVLGSPAPGGLGDIKKRIDRLIEHSKFIDDGDRVFVRMLLSELPKGDALLHGDFHPGNILTRGGKYYIIDWFNAATGNYLSDIAHTYLLLADKPRVPGEGYIRHKFLRTFAVWFAGLYLKEMKANLGFDMGELSTWMVVRAADRTVHGQLSELQSRADFVKTCRKLHEQGVPPEVWHKKL